MLPASGFGSALCLARVRVHFWLGRVHRVACGGTMHTGTPRSVDQGGPLTSPELHLVEPCCTRRSHKPPRQDEHRRRTRRFARLAAICKMETLLGLGPRAQTACKPHVGVHGLEGPRRCRQCFGSRIMSPHAEPPQRWGPLLHDCAHAVHAATDDFDLLRESRDEPRAMNWEDSRNIAWET